MEDKMNETAKALRDEFKKIIAEGAGTSFEETGVAMPADSIWERYANVVNPASYPHLVGVKQLEWKRSGWIEAFSQPVGFGFWYSISPAKPVHGPGDPPFTCYAIWGVPGNSERDCLGSDFQSLEEAKTVAQADFERRILSALSAAPEADQP